MARQVLITGVTGGIGGALAESFTANGDMVIGIGRRKDKLTALRDRLGESLDSLQADLETVEGIDAAVDALGDRANAIDVLVNNAGSMKFTPTHALNAHDVHSQLAINLLAPIWLTRKLLPGMIDRKSGLIVNMASAAGERPSPKLAAYGAAKAGLIHFTRTLAAEYADAGIRCVAIAPGPVHTGLVDKFTMAMIVKSVPLKRAALPAEIADFVRYIASDAVNLATGSVFTVDGGLSIRS